jgi:hypothetical protein
MPKQNKIIRMPQGVEIPSETILRLEINSLQEVNLAEVCIVQQQDNCTKAVYCIPFLDIASAKAYCKKLAQEIEHSKKQVIDAGELSKGYAVLGGDADV